MFRYFLACLVLLLINEAAAAQFFSIYVSSIAPQVSVSVTTCTAPCPVFFDATATTSQGDTSFPFHELYYKWDFGDADAKAKNWSYGSSNSVNTCGDAAAGQQTYCAAMPTLNMNVGFGPIVGHVYHVKGTYLPSVTITSKSGSVTKVLPPITVADPDTIYGGAWCTNPSGACGGTGTNCRFGGDGGSPAGSIGCSVCLSNTATYTGCPASAGHDPLSQCCVVQNIINNYLISGTSYRVLLHAGETFNTSATASASPTPDCSNCVFSSYDTGAQPIIATQVAFASTFALEIGKTNVSVQNFTISNLNIDGFSFANGCIQPNRGSSNILMENLTCSNIHEVLLVQGTVALPLQNIFAINISAKNIGGSGFGGAACNSAPYENNYWQNVNNIVVLGWDLENGTNEQSMMRFQSWQKMEIGYNYFARPCILRATYDIRGDGIASTLDQYANVHHNVSVGEATVGNTSGPGMAVQPQITDGSVQNIIFSENFCILGSGSAQCISFAEASMATLRNNIVSGVNVPNGSGGSEMIAKWDGNLPQPANVWAYNNTYYCGTGINLMNNAMWQFQTQYVQGGTILKNNLYYCPNASGAVVVQDSTPSSSPVTANNSDTVPGGGTTVDPKFVNGGGSLLLTRDYALQSMSYGKAAGANNVPVFFDFVGKAVPQMSPTIGALQ